MSTWQSDNIFAGTAWYYARFRPDYPEELIKSLTDKFTLAQQSRVLDLGCGTGQISLQLAPYVFEVIAIDPQEDMLKEGKSIATEKGIANIKWILGDSSQLTHLTRDIGELDLTVIARAFHWMDREQTLKDLYHLTKRGGGLAIVWDDGPRDSITTSKWKSVLDEAVRFWLGEVRLAGTKGTYNHPTRRFEDYLQESDFQNLESVEIKTGRSWTTDQVIGYLYSTSSSSIPVLGDKKEHFEADVRRRLLAINPDGVFEEEVTTSTLMAWKI
jgi:ubiquinone/menaquinone biosynthesis C-methylase UbiE